MQQFINIRKTSYGGRGRGRGATGRFTFLFRLSGSRSRTEDSSLTILIDGLCVGYRVRALHYNGIYASDCNIRCNLATAQRYLWHGRGNDSKLRQ